MIIEYIINGGGCCQGKVPLMQIIEKLITYGRNEPAINPTLLQYLSVDDLINTKKKLLERVGTLSEEDKAWLEQFKSLRGMNSIIIP